MLLTLVTCGIYGIYWMYCFINDLNTASGETNAPSALKVILLFIVTCGIYMIYWFYKAGEKVNKIHELSGQPEDKNAGILYLVLSLVGLSIVNYCLIQNEMNKVAAIKA